MSWRLPFWPKPDPQAELFREINARLAKAEISLLDAQHAREWAEAQEGELTARVTRLRERRAALIKET